MDDGEVFASDHALLPNPNCSSNFPGSTSVDTFFDEILNTQTCTHTHTCNPPGPDAAHTHTCNHTHTQVLSSEDDDDDDDDSKNKERSIPKPRRRRPLGNREAVRKYRDKKKAHTAYLEEEIRKLQVLNQQLVGKIQAQATLEAEFLRLKGLVLELRGKIDNELGGFPSKNNVTVILISRKVSVICSLVLGQWDFIVNPIYRAPVHLSGHPSRLVSVQGKKHGVIRRKFSACSIDCRSNTNEAVIY